MLFARFPNDGNSGDTNQGMLICRQILKAGMQILGVCAELCVWRRAALCRAVSWAVNCNFVLVDLLLL